MTIMLCVQIIPVLYLGPNEILHVTVKQFMATDECGHYLDDGEVC